MNSAPNPRPIIATLTVLSAAFAIREVLHKGENQKEEFHVGWAVPTVAAAWWAQPTLRLGLDPPQANQAHIIVLRRLAQEPADILDDRRPERLEIAPQFLHLLAEAIDRVNRAPQID